MPHRRPPALHDNATPTARANFRQRYDELEAQRAVLVARFRKLSKDAHQHPSYKSALKLLNSTFRRSKLAQRLVVLNAAAWLIDVLEWITLGPRRSQTTERRRKATSVPSWAALHARSGPKWREKHKCGRLITDA